jgi:hypothetical protein
VKPDLLEAVRVTTKFLRSFFPEVADQAVTIQLYVNSERVGVWEKGELTLLGEQPAGGK